MAVTARPLPEMPAPPPVRVATRGRFRFAALDGWTLGYLVVVSCALAARWHLPIPRPGLVVLAHALILVTVLLVAALRRIRPRSAVADWYALFLLQPVYSELGLLNTIQGISHDTIVQSWDAALFGGQPSFDWIRAVPSPALSVILHLAYLSYYFIVLCTPLTLWISGRKDAARITILRIMSTFYLCYTIFLLFPVAGPRYLFPHADNAATRIGLARFTQDLLNGGASWGTAFPSSHVAVAVVAGLSAWLAWRLFGSVVVVLSLLLTVATVYGQFHYAVDALAGLAVGIAMLFIVPRDRSAIPLDQARPIRSGATEARS